MAQPAKQIHPNNIVITTNVVVLINRLPTYGSSLPRWNLPEDAASLPELASLPGQQQRRQQPLGGGEFAQTDEAGDDETAEVGEFQ